MIIVWQKVVCMPNFPVGCFYMLHASCILGSATTISLVRYCEAWFADVKRSFQRLEIWCQKIQWWWLLKPTKCCSKKMMCEFLTCGWKKVGTPTHSHPKSVVYCLNNSAAFTFPVAKLRTLTSKQDRLYGSMRCPTLSRIPDPKKCVQCW